MIRAIHHVQLAMPADREGEAVAFYEGTLGIPQLSKPVNLDRRGGCWFKSATAEIHLGVEEPFAPARKSQPAFLVDDLAEVRERLASAGREIIDGEPMEGYVRFYTSDPFGNRIELASTGTSQQ